MANCGISAAQLSHLPHERRFCYNTIVLKVEHVLWHTGRARRPAVAPTLRVKRSGVVHGVGNLTRAADATAYYRFG